MVHSWRSSKMPETLDDSFPFYIVDVFTEGGKKYTGNQLAVVRNARSLSQSQKQSIAREMHFSETSFILSDEKRGNGFDVRIFTPGTELPFAGHPTLGTALVIQQETIKRAIGSLYLNLRIGQIPVSIFYKEGRVVRELWMRQKDPSFKGDGSHSIRDLATVLGIGEDLFDRRFPVEDVSTGLPTTIIPLKSLKAVRRARVNQSAYFDYVKDREAKGILIFSSETYNHRNHLNARFFAESYGVSEDPATGSANGCLAGYLMKNRYFKSDVLKNIIRVEQGYEIGRPSMLLLKAIRDRTEKKKIHVQVGGNARIIASGTLI